MKKRILSLGLVFALLIGIFSFVNNTEAQTKKTTKAPVVKTFKGEVVSLSNLASGGKGKVLKDEAKKMAEAGNPIVFKIGKKIYFVYHEDGTFAAKKLANYAEAKVVGIQGTTKTIGGLNFIYANMIEIME